MFLPSKIGGLMDPMLSWLFMMMDLPSSDQASSEGPALIPIVGNNTEREVNQCYQIYNFISNRFIYATSGKWTSVYMRLYLNQPVYM